MKRRFACLAALLVCVVSTRAEQLIASVADQEVAVIGRGKLLARYSISTSKFGLGDAMGSYRTPTGDFYVSAKFGDHLAPGAVIKSRVPTGEVLQANASGRDAIVSRVIWLRGTEPGNRNARDRCIYIHGTAEERFIGRRASFGCIRMRSRDVIALYQLVHIGTHIRITEKRLRDFLPAEEPSLLARSD
jgi:lipoprotein-anchoring transpeptidase ErfK/SrfK